MQMIHGACSMMRLEMSTQPIDSKGMIILDLVSCYRTEDIYLEYVAMSGYKVWIDKLVRPALYASGDLDNLLWMCRLEEDVHTDLRETLDEFQ